MAETTLALTDPEHAVTQLDPNSVSREVVIADGDHDVAAVDLSAWAGASSEASLASGVPSARMQRVGDRLCSEATRETTLGDRAQTMSQDLKP